MPHRLDDLPRTGRRRPGRRLAGATALAALTLGACGGASDSATNDDAVASADTATGVDVEETGTDSTDAAAGTTPDSDLATEATETTTATADTVPVEAPAGEDDGADVAASSGIADLLGPDVVATSEIETNGLPSVVVDDVTSGRKVNFRNLVPQDRPILMWMWAPH